MAGFIIMCRDLSVNWNWEVFSTVIHFNIETYKEISRHKIKNGSSHGINNVLLSKWYFSGCARIQKPYKAKFVSLELKNHLRYWTIKALKIGLKEVEWIDSKLHNTEIPCHIWKQIQAPTWGGNHLIMGIPDSSIPGVTVTEEVVFQESAS